MTYVEFFDKTAVENISTCLSQMPQRVIFVGDDKNLMEKHRERYERIFQVRGYNIEILCVATAKNDLEEATQVLQEIVDTYDECVFDITGGDEILTFALGIVYAKNPHNDIKIHKFNLRNNAIYDCDEDGDTVFCQAPQLSVDENVIIYGGDICYGNVDEGKTYLWDMNTEFAEDIGRIWDICRSDVKSWNVQGIAFEVLEKIGRVSDDGLGVYALREDVRAYLETHKAPFILNERIISQLKRDGLLTYFYADSVKICMSYKNHQVKKCLTKSGLALEMKVYATAATLCDEKGDRVYNDVLNGVVIDWDGEFHDERREDVYDTENEIDVLMMHGVVPVFVSCKNGAVTMEELYKLNTVATRFGDKYAKKVLVATSIPKGTGSGKYFRQRAKDMKIRLIEDVQLLEDKAFAEKMKNLWR